ncbi:ataxin-2 isoform X2 [Scleropages formosus]|uniref:ataxin-2 isoform X2 n=1 Tax=Scleropages formosus TaxID=113540 RepID=UPI0008782BB9|nr:ataxin-2 isoform X2 [Scleropages formosus]
MSMKQAGGNRKPGGAAAASGTGGGGGGAGGRQSAGRGRNSVKGPSSTSLAYSGVYANMRMVHVLTSVVGTKCELKVRNGVVYEGVFKTYGPECELVLDAAHRKGPEPVVGPRHEDIVESIIFKASDVVVVQFKDIDLNYAKKDNFTDSAVSARLNGEHKEKDLKPWDGGEQHGSDSLESLDADMSNGWDPNDMFRFNEETYGVKSTYDSSLSSYTVPLERDNSEEFLKREARATQLAEEIEASATYKARVALENDLRSEEEKFTAVVRAERESHTPSGRENKYVPPGQRNKEGLSWGAGRQNSPRMVQSNNNVPSTRPGPHDYSLSSAADRVLNGGATWPSPCPSPSRPPSRYQSGSTSLPPRATTPTRPSSRPPSRPTRPPSHPSVHGSSAPVSTMPKRMSTEGPLRMSPKTQRTPRAHRLSSSRGGIPSGVDFIPHSAPVDASIPPPAHSSMSGGTWSSVVSGAHRPRSPKQTTLGSSPAGSCPQVGTTPIDPVAVPVSPTTASLASNQAITPSTEAKESRVQETRQMSPVANKEIVKPVDTSPSIGRPVNKGPPAMGLDHRKQIDNLKEFSVVFRLHPSSTPDPLFDPVMSKQPRDPVEKSKEFLLDKGVEPVPKASHEASTGDKIAPPPPAPTMSTATPNTSISPGSSSSPSSPSSSASPASVLCPAPEYKRGPEVTSQGVQTTGPGSKLDGQEDKEEKKDSVQEQVRKSTLNPNAKEFNPRTFCTQPKPATTPTPPRPQGQPSPSVVVPQPPTVYSQTVCFPQMYPLTPVSPGVQKSIIWKPPAMYHVQVPHMTVSQTKPYRAVPSMPQQRQDQHHSQGTPTMMHPASATGPSIVASSPAYSAQYFTCSPQQFTSQTLVQQMPHYQSQAQHVFSSVMQGSARMMAPPTHGQPSLVSSSTTQYAEQTHAMYVSPGPIPQSYSHPSATLHAQHPQPSATPTGQQQQGQHAGSHPAPSPVQHQAAQALHLGTPSQQQMYSALTPTPPSMNPGPNTQSTQASFPSAQQAVYIHTQQVQHGYNPSHMAHVQQAHLQSGVVPSHHTTPSHPPMMLMATQPPGGPQHSLPQSALPPIPVSSTAHFSYMAHPSGRFPDPCNETHVL